MRLSAYHLIKLIGLGKILNYSTKFTSNCSKYCILTSHQNGLNMLIECTQRSSLDIVQLFVLGRSSILSTKNLRFIYYLVSSALWRPFEDFIRCRFRILTVPVLDDDIPTKQSTFIHIRSLHKLY